ncbi:MAG: hypothetical protein IKC10_00730 [Alphaproteobacteria bacterium]|nr:hypothetical protein [Alphaproteobacteria bacterium]
MNKCEELQQIIDEGNILKSSAKISMFPNNFGYPTQALTVDTAELLKWNTKIDLLLKKHDNPVRNPKRQEFPNYNIVQYLNIKIKILEGLLETWKNEEVQEDISTAENIEVSIPKQEEQKKINSSTIGTWVGVLVAIIALIWGIYTYFTPNNIPTNSIAEHNIAPINVNGSNNTVILQQNQDNGK